VHLIVIKKIRCNAINLNGLLPVTPINGLLKVVTMAKRKLSGMVAVVTRITRSITTKIDVQTSEHAWDVISPWTKTRLGTGLAPGSGDLW
jgi:hypothetical protein